MFGHSGYLCTSFCTTRTHTISVSSRKSLSTLFSNPSKRLIWGQESPLNWRDWYWVAFRSIRTTGSPSNKFNTHPTSSRLKSRMPTANFLSVLWRNTSLRNRHLLFRPKPQPPMRCSTGTTWLGRMRGELGEIRARARQGQWARIALCWRGEVGWIKVTCLGSSQRASICGITLRMRRSMTVFKISEADPTITERYLK